ncbi:MAG TPA: rod-binding protein [Planctomycetaceae bacterium]|nr:rod-binding protein [Planctomycetaceae bacterium]
MTAAIASISPSTTPDLQPTFQKAFAGMLFGQMLKAMRATVGKPAYLHGGQAEEMFQQQLDQTIVESLSTTHGGDYVGELYDQFRRQMNLPAESSQTSDPAHSAISIEQARSRSLANLVESSRRAQPGADGMGITSDTTGLTALLRK